MSGWLDAADWKRAQETVPITCVDVVPLRVNGAGVLHRVGLIFRETPHQGKRWCVVGGRLWRNESVAEAIGRQVRETLGPDVRFSAPVDPQPHYVAQYFTTRRSFGLVDPRQHAVTLNFCVAIEGEPKAMGEAVGFEWFEPEKMPPPEQFGFEQDRVVAASLASWRRLQDRA